VGGGRGGKFAKGKGGRQPSRFVKNQGLRENRTRRDLNPLRKRAIRESEGGRKGKKQPMGHRASASGKEYAGGKTIIFSSKRGIRLLDNWGFEDGANNRGGERVRSRRG